MNSVYTKSRTPPEFTELIKNSDLNSHEEQFSDGIEGLLKELARLNGIREQIDHFTIPIEKEVEYFSSLNAMSMDIISKMALMCGHDW